MKKIALCSILAMLIPCMSFAGTVTEACYTTKSCGAHDSVVWKVGGAVNGWMGGSILGTAILPGLGSWAGAIAGGYYGAKLGGKLGHKYKANEYIYFDDGTCIECDTHQIGEDYECPNGSIVTNGEVAFRCKTTFTGDYWEEAKIPVCSDSPVKTSKSGVKYKTILRDNITNNGKVVHDGVLVFSGAVCLYITEEGREDPEPGPNPQDCKPGEERATVDIDLITACSASGGCKIVKGKCYNKNMLRCLEAAKRGEPANWNGVSCNCGDKHVWNSKTNRCDAKSNFCDQFKAYPNRYKCCLAGKATRWEGEVSSGQCICVENGKTWSIDSGKCVGGNVVPPAGNCDAYVNDASLFMCCNMAKLPNAEVTFDNGACNCIDQTKQWNGQQCVANVVSDDCWYEFHSDILCANNVRIQYDKRINLKDKLNGQNCETFKLQFDNDTKKLNELKAQYCREHGYQPYVDPELENAKSRLAAFFKSAEGGASVWKDSEGKFNTARLASDITAGVVLGTVGGVISGVVIPKKQKEKGFEALNCTVGGQKMADWGDEFRVDFRR